MQRVPNFPLTKCNIKMPDCVPNTDAIACEDENEQQQRRQQLINFGHSQWGFNNWNWSVTKQDLDFVDFANGKYCVGVAAFVSINVKSLDLHRENVGYATSVANTKGLAIYKSRKCAVTNALRETLLSFGGTVANELMEATVETHRSEANNSVPPESPPETKPVLRPTEPPKNQPLPLRNDVNGVAPPIARAQPMPVNVPSVPRVQANVVPPPVVTPVVPPPVAQPVPQPVAQPIAPHQVAGRGPRNQNVSFLLQPFMGGMMGGMYPRLAAPAPTVYPEYYECPGPWHFACDGTARPTIGPRDEQATMGAHMHAHAHTHGPHHPHGVTNRGCWIKPTIFYDGFWTEQKVKRWVAEQVEKRFPGDQQASKVPTPDASANTQC